ncbi:MAG: hypothetical protein BZ137_01900 [Methanosphaera sp. rholeuAM130]|nr:MAG: hypothetical protein BZ137_01900 [Methanosphaera sp. rholeuAM130]
MSKCQNCGFENDEGQSICKKCHYLLKESEKTNDGYMEDNDNTNSNTNINNTKSNVNQNTINTDTFDENGSRSHIIEDNYRNSYKYADGYYLLDNVELISENVSISRYQNKSLFLGCLLSFFITGMGNVYAGLKKRGIVEFILSLIINAFIPVTPEFLIDFNSYVLYLALIWEIYVVYDTYKCIKAINADKEIPLFLGFINLK